MLNLKQRVALWIGIALVALMGLVPPWKEVTPFRRPLGYALVFSPPVDPPERPFVVPGVPPRDFLIQHRVQDARIDFGRLLLQWAVVAVVTGGLIVTLAQRSDGG